MDLSEAVAALRAGGVVGFPTDTVYGLAVLQGGEAKVYEVKGRPAEQPLILMVADAVQAEAFVSVDPRARWYMERWWPGPLTLVLPAGEGTLGVRIPDHPVALELLRAAGPLLTTSANRHGAPPALTAEEASRLPGLAGVLDGGRVPGGEPSTVIALLPGREMTVIREGAISSHLLGDDEHV
ncbi:MAG: L-threonylcarbamoyladenylate synthase [Candidatus Dormibacteraeota bacterium]|nr:L-threonylcarbamoyladenylate synthase [Candidatus Dormibacteraeota bacterium]